MSQAHSSAFSARLPAPLLAVLALTSCQPTTPAMDVDTEARAIERLHAEWAEAEVAKDLDASLAFLTPDAVLQPPNAAPIQGQDAIRQFYLSMFQLPIAAMTMGPTTVVVSESGDVAADWGSLTLVLNGNAGPVTDTLKFMAVWQRRNGEWKVVANSWSSNAAPTR